MYETPPRDIRTMTAIWSRRNSKHLKRVEKTVEGVVGREEIKSLMIKKYLRTCAREE